MTTRSWCARPSPWKNASPALQEGAEPGGGAGPWRLELRGVSLPADTLLRLEALDVSPAPALPPLLRAEGLWLRAGDRVALLGANGTGKSSLLRQCWRELTDLSPQAGWYCHPGAASPITISPCSSWLTTPP